MAAESKANVNTPCQAYEDMARHWLPCQTLMGGTLAMRDAAETYLPKFSAETNTRYDTRLAEAVLHEAYSHAVQTLSLRPFGAPVQIADGASAYYGLLAEDVDGAGTSLTTFATQCMVDLLVYGVCHIMADYPNTLHLSESLGRRLTRADEQREGIRAYLVRVPPTAVIGWRGGRRGSNEYLSRLRIRFRRTEYVDDYEEATTQYVAEWTPEAIATHAQNDRGDWVRVEDAPNTLGRIPLVTIYAQREGLLVSYPPLERLAWLNIKHWQQSSDQDQIEKVARVPMLHLRGFSSDEIESIQIGPYRIIGTKSADAQATILETNGNAVKVGRVGLESLVRTMMTMAMAPLERQAGNPTATELRIEEGRHISDIEAYVMKLEKALGDALALCAQWDGMSIPAPTVKISQDFSAIGNPETDLSQLTEDYKLGAISQRTYLWERQRRGLYAEDLNIDDEIEETKHAAGVMMFGGEGGG